MRRCRTGRASVPRRSVDISGVHSREELTDAVEGGVVIRSITPALRRLGFPTARSGFAKKTTGCAVSVYGSVVQESGRCLADHVPPATVTPWLTRRTPSALSGKTGFSLLSTDLGSLGRFLRATSAPAQADTTSLQAPETVRASALKTCARVNRTMRSRSKHAHWAAVVEGESNVQGRGGPGCIDSRGLPGYGPERQADLQIELSSGITCSPTNRTCSPRSGKPSTSIPAQALKVNGSVNETSAWLRPAGA
jgi:hypothetical protein